LRRLWRLDWLKTDELDSSFTEPLDDTDQLCLVDDVTGEDAATFLVSNGPALESQESAP